MHILYGVCLKLCTSWCGKDMLVVPTHVVGCTVATVLVAMHLHA